MPTQPLDPTQPALVWEVSYTHNMEDPINDNLDVTAYNIAEALAQAEYQLNQGAADDEVGADWFITCISMSDKGN